MAVQSEIFLIATYFVFSNYFDHSYISAGAENFKNVKAASIYQIFPQTIYFKVIYKLTVEQKTLVIVSPFGICHLWATG